MRSDPRVERLREAIGDQSPRSIERVPEHVEAAVGVVLRSRDELELLLVRRAERDEDPWSGHVGLPGGRREAGDDDLVHTALRETEEETGIVLAQRGLRVGFLDEVTPATPFLPPIVIAPLVVAVPADTIAEPEPREVRDAVWAPLSVLRDPGAADEHVERLEGRRVRFPAIRVDDFVVWGLTLRIVTDFLEVADRARV